MAIDIHLQPDSSLAEIRDEMALGTSVMRSAHVGNARAYNLAIAELGIPMLLVDHTIVAQNPDQPGDKNYLPGSIVTRERIRPLSLSEIGQLALRTEVTDPDNLHSHDTRYVDELHAASLRSAFPGTDFFTNTEYLRANESVAQDVIGVMLDTRPDLFSRVVESDGTLRTSDCASQLVPIYGILQLNDCPRTERGVLVPNEADILVNFVVEALKSGRQKQIHLSGPDMQHYIKDPAMRTALDTLYDRIRSDTSFGADLPEILQVELIPSDRAGFATTKERAPVLERIFQVIAAQEAHAEHKRSFFTGPTGSATSVREAFMSRSRQQEAVLSCDLQEAVTAANELFVGSKEAPYTSQYDVLQEGGLAMPPDNLNRSMTDLGRIRKKLQKIRDSL